MPTNRSAAPVRTGGDRCPGALRLHEAADGHLARIRVPGGLLTADQVVALADAADTLGDGVLHLTARGNVEVRGLAGDEDGARLGRLLAAADLLPSDTHERVRNIVATPAAGLDGAGHSGDLTGVVRILDSLLCRTPEAAALSGRFLFGLDDGRGDVLALDPDVAARWVGAEHAEIVLGGSPAFVLPAAQVPRALVGAALAFLTARDDAAETGWRIADLDSRAAVVASMVSDLVMAFPDAEPITDSPVGDDARAVTGSAGPLAPGGLGDSSVNLVLRLGAAPTATWWALATTAREGDGLVRTTPGRSLILAGLDPGTRAALLDQAADLGVIAAADDPAFGVSACIGHPGCASALADVRADVEAVLADCAHDADADADVDGIAQGREPVHVSGCDRRCGHPRRPHLEAVAIGGGEEHTYATARAHGSPATGTPPGDGRDDLGTLLERTGR